MRSDTDILRLRGAGLPAEARAALRQIRDLAGSHRVPAYAVGGCVRDLLLGIPTRDIDVVVEGDGPAFARRLARRMGCAVVAHEAFGTATVLVSHRLRLDIAMARREMYLTPAALPVVEPASIGEDLRRRDFSINAMAIRLDGADYGALIDDHGGHDDLRRQVIRVLHAGSFVDDPTRAFRALRYEQRLGFRLEPQTHRRLCEAVAAGVLRRLSGHRVLQEIKAGLEERRVGDILRRWSEFGLLTLLHPTVRWTSRLNGIVSAAAQVAVARRSLLADCKVEAWEVAFLAVMQTLHTGVPAQVCRHLPLPRALRRICLQGFRSTEPTLRTLCADRRRRMPSSRVYGLLRPIPLPVLFLWLAMVGPGRDGARGRGRILRYLTTLRDVRPDVSGRDLKRLGVKEGPAYRRIFSGLLRARLDGRVRSKAEELALVRRVIRTPEPPTGRPGARG